MISVLHSISCYYVIKNVKIMLRDNTSGLNLSLYHKSFKLERPFLFIIVYYMIFKINNK